MSKSVATVQCQCKHEFQDKNYGEQKRLANKTMRGVGQGNVEVRCTVCSKTHTISEQRLR